MYTLIINELSISINDIIKCRTIAESHYINIILLLKPAHQQGLLSACLPPKRTSGLLKKNFNTCNNTRHYPEIIAETSASTTDDIIILIWIASFNSVLSFITVIYGVADVAVIVLKNNSVAVGDKLGERVRSLCVYFIVFWSRLYNMNRNKIRMIINFRTSIQQ